MSKISCHDKHLLIINSQQKIEGKGRGNFKQLLYGYPIQQLSFSAIATCSTHCLAIATDGRVFGWGCNISKQISPDDEPEYDSLEFSEFSNKIASVACHQDYSMFLTKGGFVYFRGHMSDVLLEGHLTCIYSPPTHVIAIAAGYNFNLILTKDGDVFGMGVFYKNNENSLVRICSQKYIPILQENNIVDISAGNSHYLLRNREGQVFIGGSALTQNNQNTGCLGGEEHITHPQLVEFPPNTYATAIIASEYQSLIVLNTGVLLVSGKNEYRQLGLSLENGGFRFWRLHYLPKNKVIIDIAMGSYFTCLLMHDGSLYASGQTPWGQINVFQCVYNSGVPTLKAMSRAFVVNQYRPYFSYAELENMPRDVFNQDPLVIYCEQCKFLVKPNQTGLCPYPHELINPPISAAAAAAAEPKPDLKSRFLKFIWGKRT